MILNLILKNNYKYHFEPQATPMFFNISRNYHALKKRPERAARKQPRATPQEQIVHRDMRPERGKRFIVISHLILLLLQSGTNGWCYNYHRALPWAIFFCLFEAFLEFLKTNINANYKYYPLFSGNPPKLPIFRQ